MLKKAYVEITNRCNLSCAFCPKTKRAPRDMSAAEFDAVLERLAGAVSYVYLHVMGEPLAHPQLAEIFAAAAARRQKICITTNGTLLKTRGELLLTAPTLHKVSVSLHSFEGNDFAEAGQENYLAAVWDFAEKAAEAGIIVALRLWNEGGMETRNDAILAYLKKKCPGEWLEGRDGSFRMAERLYLERAGKFDWPDMGAEEVHTEFCYGLRDQIGILADGTVVPCCLDHEGDIALGNILRESLGEILKSARARALREGFSRRQPTEALCRRCGYASRFNLRGAP